MGGGHTSSAKSLEVKGSAGCKNQKEANDENRVIIAGPNGHNVLPPDIIAGPEIIAGPNGHNVLTGKK